MGPSEGEVLCHRQWLRWGRTLWNPAPSWSRSGWTVHLSLLVPSALTLKCFLLAVMFGPPGSRRAGVCVGWVCKVGQSPFQHGFLFDHHQDPSLLPTLQERLLSPSTNEALWVSLRRHTDPESLTVLECESVCVFVCMCVCVCPSLWAPGERSHD